MSEQEPRKATDVLLALETKVDHLMLMHRTLDLNIKIMSNKLNQLLDVLTSIPETSSVSPGFVPSEFIPSPQNNFLDNALIEHQQEANSQNYVLPIESSPVGFRRTSRPETFNDGEKLTEMPLKKNVPTPSMPIPVMRAPLETKEGNSSHAVSSGTRQPIMQRIVDKNGKAVFMAEVEIINSKSNIVELKTRTNGVGKYQVSLVPGLYKVNVRKQGSVGKDKMEISQNLTVDASTPQELPIMIIK